MRLLLWILCLCLGGFLYTNPHAWHKAVSFAHVGNHAAPTNEVVMYARTTCGICKNMATQMDAAGIDYEEYYVDTDNSQVNKLFKRLRNAGYTNINSSPVPTIFVGNHVYWGMTPISTIQQAMSEAVKQ